MRHYPYRCIKLLSELKESGVLDNVAALYEEAESTAFVVVVKSGRFFAEFIGVHRTSKNRYRIYCKNEYYSRESTEQCFRLVKDLINKIKFL